MHANPVAYFEAVKKEDLFKVIMIVILFFASDYHNIRVFLMNLIRNWKGIFACAWLTVSVCAKH